MFEPTISGPDSSAKYRLTTNKLPDNSIPPANQWGHTINGTINGVKSMANQWKSMGSDWIDFQLSL